MIIKVCGMREKANISALAQLNPTMIGFIFYEKSPRYVGSTLVETPSEISRVGVFVNASFDEIILKAQSFKLSHIQLHGSESVELCGRLQDSGLKVIKAISVEGESDLEACKKYDSVVDFILLDTKCSQYGGSGRRFDWSILSSYSAEAPFLLSGGIDEDMAEEIALICHPKFKGVDLNSRFEISPGVKNIEKLTNFISTIKNITQ